MTIQHTRTAPSRRVPPAARQPGPVTVAIRGLRPNEVPTWEMRQREIEAEEREALRALRRRVAEAVTLGIAFLDETDGDPDLEADYTTVEHASEGGLLTLGRSTDDEPDEDREDDAGDNPEEENEHGSACDLGEDSLGSLHGTAAGVHFGQYAWSSGRPGDFEADIQSEPHDEDTDREPSLCGITVSAPSQLGDDREHDEAERGIADMDGAAEQFSLVGRGCYA